MKVQEIVKKMSKKLNYLKEGVVLDYYYEFLQLIIAELRENGGFEVPDFGKFKVLVAKPRRMKEVRTGQMINLPSIRIIKFYPHRKLKEYFKNLVK